MILDFFFQVIRWFIQILDFIAPDYDTFPLPSGFISAVSDLFGWMTTFMSIPIVRVFAEFIVVFVVPVGLALVTYWILKRILNFVRGSGSI